MTFCQLELFGGLSCSVMARKQCRCGETIVIAFKNKVADMLMRKYNLVQSHICVSTKNLINGGAYIKIGITRLPNYPFHQQETSFLCCKILAGNTW